MKHSKPWLNHYQKGVPEAITYEDTCLPEFLERSALSFPDKTALLFQGRKIQYYKLKDMVDRFATCLYKLGIRKGDAVAILLPNLIPCVVSYYAALKIGGIAVMNNPLYSDQELKHQFTSSGAKVLITLDLLVNRVLKLRPETRIKQIVYTSIGDYLPFPKNFFFKLVAKKKNMAADVKPAQDLYRWKKILNASLPEMPKIELSFNDVAMYQFTGGTTGIPKAVLLTHGNLSKQIQQIAAWFPSLNKGGETILGALPFFHVFGLSTVMNFAIYMGWKNVLVPKPQPAPLLEAIIKFRPTFVPLVPTMFTGMLNHPDLKKFDLTFIKGFFSGSAPLSVEVIKAFEDKTGGVIVEGYGLTETSPVTHINPFAGGKRKTGGIGLPVPDTQCRIVDLKDGETTMPVGEAGELLIKGPQVMRGYKNEPEETARVIKNGWLYTGDIARMDEDGYFYIVDRKKDMIISGGYNVYPNEIETVFYEHPKVLEACVIGIPHAYRGESIKVFVALKQGESVTTQEFMEYCQARLAKYKLPTEIEFKKELPKTSVGKILRKALRTAKSAAENNYF